jgi:hypothetical protein
MGNGIMTLDVIFFYCSLNQDQMIYLEVFFPLDLNLDMVSVVEKRSLDGIYDICCLGLRFWIFAGL